ncbi:hypothetical protein MPS_3475 [Mycobacterium pseudoshottsii JCM 15466]|uniref:Uncharacterized protein n=1 Tax=Mycobacterium ulcerans str. Harvey TaxID=1299332 RepID=A0ABP3AIC4_MYCUL|nr:hypothetical protein I551_2698 [Mycobacterium ulcerans str. Harvey]GAQ37095.1 hypothetical protein MPS_3475 [Mycobacterium pseudoshottsii JCM 15466]
MYRSRHGRRHPEHPGGQRQESKGQRRSARAAGPWCTV